ncbi:TadE/TadG family type IV pilus assembly protein [Massilia sp. YIM B02763]|uniref:TadE/TadG family type IV pilus assembly protein n=1 Tax=Massilia sp. YIM B02763 TaxID=3050130 RepID=UPI0025B708F6|nr:TadE/TadG family type IV pilus assembly protein [Massilia sp. YIM B02763]MDN4055914.1 TadE/TadG family type IV pilus assembly protein [Massilia sp. YIM B02763]
MINKTKFRRQSGATIVEMAIVAPVVLLVLLSLLELSLMFFSTLTMQYAIREGGRFALTGQTSLDPAVASQRYSAVIQKIKNNSMGFYDKLGTTISVNGTKYTTSTYSNAMFGNAGDIIVMRLDCDWKVTTPLLAAFFTDGKYHFAVATVMRNEFFF